MNAQLCIVYVSLDIGYESKIYYQKEYADSTYLITTHKINIKIDLQIQ